MVGKSIKLNDQWYEVPIAWKKYLGTWLLSNYSDAEKNQKSEKLIRNPLINILQKDISDRQILGTFLAHFPVAKTDKDTTKTRIVFDSSGKKRWYINE